MAIRIFKQAFMMLWNNLGNAARVSVVPFITMFLFGFVAAGASIAIGSSASSIDGFFVITSVFTIFLLVAFFVFIAWALVGWHRFVLLEEYPKGFVPKWYGDEIKGYILYLLLLCIVGLIAYIPVALFFISATSGGVQLFAFVILPIIPLVMAVAFRLMIGLPARAIGQRMSLGECWSATQGKTGMLYGFSWLIVLFSIGMGLLGLAVQFIPVLGVLVYLVMQWFTAMFNASVLTVLYGVMVQGRVPA